MKRLLIVALLAFVPAVASARIVCTDEGLGRQTCRDDNGNTMTGERNDFFNTTTWRNNQTGETTKCTTDGLGRTTCE